jgi:hypothetical protein
LKRRTSLSMHLNDGCKVRVSTKAGLVFQKNKNLISYYNILMADLISVIHLYYTTFYGRNLRF